MKPRDPYDWEAWAWDAIERAGDDLPGLAGLVLLLLAKHSNRDGVARPSARTVVGYLGRTDKPVRKALDLLADLELISGEKVHGKPTVWQLRRADPVSAVEERPVRTLGPQWCGPTADQVRTKCGPRSPTKVKVKVKVKKLLSHSLPKLRTCEREKSSSIQGTSSSCGRWPHDRALLHLLDAVGLDRRPARLSQRQLPRPRSHRCCGSAIRA
jgi:hypothetical protein